MLMEKLNNIVFDKIEMEKLISTDSRSYSTDL